MKIFLSYKQTGIEKDSLKKELQFFRDFFQKKNIKNFIYYFDDDSTQSAKYILKECEKNIDTSDTVIAYVISSDKSEGQLLELWYAKAKNKNIIIFMQKKCVPDFFFTKSITEKIYFFDRQEEISEILEKIF